MATNSGVPGQLDTRKGYWTGRVLNDEELAEHNRIRDEGIAGRRRGSLMLIGLDENERPFAKPEVVAAEREAQRLDATEWPAALVEEQEARRIAEQHLEGMHEATERADQYLDGCRTYLAEIETEIAAAARREITALVEHFCTGAALPEAFDDTALFAERDRRQRRNGRVEEACAEVAAMETAARAAHAEACARVTACEADGIAARKLAIRREAAAAAARYEAEIEMVGVPD